MSTSWQTACHDGTGFGTAFALRRVKVSFELLTTLLFSQFEQSKAKKHPHYNLSKHDRTYHQRCGEYCSTTSHQPKAKRLQEYLVSHIVLFSSSPTLSVPLSRLTASTSTSTLVTLGASSSCTLPTLLRFVPR